jgi:hypothetical protein
MVQKCFFFVFQRRGSTHPHISSRLTRAAEKQKEQSCGARRFFKQVIPKRFAGSRKTELIQQRKIVGNDKA